MESPDDPSPARGPARSVLGGFFRLTGLAAVILAWAVILLSIYYNPWFIFTRHAFSDLGGPSVEKPWVYNYGLIAVAVLVVLYSLALVMDAVNKVEAVGGAFTLIAGLFLALIGIYHEGTTPHGFVSVWFFAQADLTITTWGMGLLIRRWRTMGAALTAMGIIAPLIAAAIDWPSAATAEAYGIILIDFWVLLMLRVHAAKRSSAQL